MWVKGGVWMFAVAVSDLVCILARVWYGLGIELRGTP